jgi:putative DNA primase/helicase
MSSDGAANGATTSDLGQEIHDQGTASGLSPEHRELLAAHAIDPDLAQEWVCTVTTPEDLPEGLPGYWSKYLPAMLYRWQHGDQMTWLLAPDDRSEHKYLFADGAEIPLNQLRDSGSGPVLIVEGAKQQFAALTHAPAEYAIYGLAGCNNWHHADWSFAIGRPVTVVFDGDLRTNRDVYNGATALLETLTLAGADPVLFGMLPAQPKSQGLDDFLARLSEHARAGAVRNLLAGAKGLPTRAPARKKGNGSPWFDEGGLKAYDVARELFKRHPMALTLNNEIAVYEGGAYRVSEAVLMGALVSLLRNDHRTSHLATVRQVLLGILATASPPLYLPERLDRQRFNVRNGLVDLVSGELHEHDSGWLSSTQFPIEYDPAAACPTFEAWAEEIIGEQLDDLEEAVAAMLDPTTTPTKAVLLYGPSRSGKGTYLRLLKATVGKENTSAVSLHQLSNDRFAAARVYGKVLNTSGDISAGHIEDISMFKQLTGEDLIGANPKYGKPFDFTNQALFAFSGNELPTVGEGSRAYSERIKPFKFGTSFAGKVDPTIETRMMAELPGILARLVRAWQRRRARGEDLRTNPAVRQEFEAASDRVQQWLDEEMFIVRALLEGQEVPAGQFSDGSTPTELHRMFTHWAGQNGHHGMGRNKLTQRLTSRDGVVEVRIVPGRVRALNIRKRRDTDDPPGTSGTFNPTLIQTGSTVERGGESDRSNIDKGEIKLPEVPADQKNCPQCGARPWRGPLTDLTHFPTCSRPRKDAS